MNNLTRHPVKRAAVGVLAGTLAFTGGAIVAGVSPANAVEGFTFDRLEGLDRFDTAADIAITSFGTADTVVLARGDNFPDALTGNYLAGVLDAPILLTRTDDVPDATRDALRTLGVDNVIIVGERAAVSDAVEADLRGEYAVERVGGVDRYETAELIAERAGGDGTTTVGTYNGLRTAVLGSGQNFPDVLAAGALSFGELFPATITFPTDLPQNTINVYTDLNIEQVIIVGGTDAVSASVEAEVEGLVDTVVRLDGTGDATNRDFDRYATARDVANFAYDELDFARTHANLARGDDFADALAGGPHAGGESAPVVLTRPSDLPASTEAFFEENCPTLTDGDIFGGTAAVSVSTEAAAELAASNCAAAPGQVTITPTGGDTNIAQGENFVGVITVAAGATIENVAVTGDCIDDDTNVTETGTAGGDFDFSIPVLTDATEGNCTITFTATVDGEDIVKTVTITVEAAVEAANLQVTPDTTDTLELVPGIDDDVSDERTYNVSGLVEGEEYRITVLAAASVTGTDAAPVFSDTDGDNLAEVGTRAAVIKSVNGGTPQDNSGDGTALADADGTQTAVFVAGADGNATFVLEGVAEESVRPVVYRNGGPGNTADDGGISPRLELNADGTAKDEADLGGITVYTSSTTGPNQTATDRPELVSASIFQTNQSGPNVGTVIRYVFDENVTGAAPDATRFNVYRFTDLAATGQPAQFDATTAQIDNNDPRAVFVRFGGIITAADLASLSVATVDQGAVFDDTFSTRGQLAENPIGDATLNAGNSSTTTKTFSAGITTAPDLVSVGNFRGDPLNDTQSLVDFTFDQAAFATAGQGGFHVILQAGTSTSDIEGEVQSGNETTTLTVVFPEEAAGGNLTTSNVARGYVEANTVFRTTGGGGGNPLQAADAGNVGNTDTPDLVSATFEFSVDAIGDDGVDDADAVTYTFDEPVRLPDAVLASTTVLGDRFLVYLDDGTQIFGDLATRSTANNNQIRVVFGQGELFNSTSGLGAVGASVLDLAVVEDTQGNVGAIARGNQEDEVAVANANVFTTGASNERTAGPDLIGVRINTLRDVFGTVTGASATYTFDRAISGDPVEADFRLVLANGVILMAENNSCTIPVSSTNASTTVTCIDYDDSTNQQSQVAAAVVGTVDDGAVNSFTGGFINPEGAEIASRS